MFGKVQVCVSMRTVCVEAHLNLGVSKNRGTPKSSILIGVSIINNLYVLSFWGFGLFSLVLGLAKHRKPFTFLTGPPVSSSVSVPSAWPGSLRQLNVGFYGK